MKLSLSWLRDFVDLGDRPPEQIATDLTLKTALIEGIERRGQDLGGVIVGKVIERKRHPDADRLSVCMVDVGDETVEIVCGAPNVAAGQTVPVARPGVLLPGGVKLKRAKIRGIVSDGMICSAAELHLGEDHDGILLLEEGLEIGQPLLDVPGMADVVFDIDNKSVTHRPDLWGHEGFARELSAIYGTALRRAPVDEALRPGTGPVAVRIDEGAACGRYVAVFAQAGAGAFGGASPGWMRRRLEACGLRPLSLAVDVSNYVMLEIGQPNHPFDRRTLRGGEIRVRSAAAGEPVVTLDGVRRLLPGGACVIADAEQVVAVAGIMGAADSGIVADTTEVVLESAWFEPQSVRRTATALGLRTDALARFEKSLDPANAERGARRYARLLREVLPGVEIAQTFASAGTKEQLPVRLTLRPERVRSRLGVAVTDDEIKRTLEAIEFRVQPAGEAFDVVVPTFRAARDVTHEEDLIEEVGRLHGYEKIEPCLPAVACAPAALPDLLAAWRNASALLTDRHGFAEVLSYAYVDDRVLARAGADHADAACLRIENPLQASASRLRRSLVPALLDFVDRNVRAFEDVRLFECGRVFVPSGDRAAELPDEPLTLAAAWAERVTKPTAGGALLRRLKGVIEDVTERLGRAVRFEKPEADPPGWAHPARCARVVAGEDAVGWLGQVHPDVAADFGWRGDVAVFEVDLQALVALPRIEHAYRPPARYPAIKIDLSFVAPFSLSYADIVAGLRAPAPLLEEVRLVDEYTGPGVGAGSRSLTLRLAFRSAEGTLTDEVVAAERKRARAWLAERGAVLRGDAAG